MQFLRTPDPLVEEGSLQRCRMANCPRAVTVAVIRGQGRGVVGAEVVLAGG